MSQKSKNTVVPWRNPEEFKKVYKYLYDEDIAKKRWAADKVALWETRCWPTLPLAVDSTVAFVRTQIQDSLYQLDKTSCQTADIESMYSSAIVRFVNAFSDTEQYLEPKEQKQSMRDVAKKSNIPTWIIDIRHNITHGRAPNLAILRMACSQILDYIKNVFWIPESLRVKCLVKTYDEGPIKKLLEEYRGLSTTIIKNTNKYNNQHGNNQSMEKLLKSMRRFLNDPVGQQKFIENLVHPKFFVTKEDIELLEVADPVFIERTDSSTSVPPLVKSFWEPMLKLLHQHDLVADFLESLLISQEHRTIKIYQKVVDFYVISVIDYIEAEVEEDGNPFQHKGVLISELCLLFACMKGASAYSDYVFKKMTSKLKMEDWKEELSALLALRRGLTLPTHNKEVPASKKRKHDMTFTVGDAEEDIRNEVTRQCPNRMTSPWCVAPVSINFSKVALGHIFNAKEKEQFEIDYENAKKEIKREEDVEIATESADIEESKPIPMPEIKPEVSLRNENLYPPSSFYKFYQNS